LRNTVIGFRYLAPTKFGFLFFKANNSESMGLLSTKFLGLKGHPKYLVKDSRGLFRKRECRAKKFSSENCKEGQILKPMKVLIFLL